ncbi:MAG: hypothetical protein R3E01_18895 [Pirellulaceae bacterium]|nr:hypothetical protein [Planctomycetales bacterium]
MTRNTMLAALATIVVATLTASTATAGCKGGQCSGGGGGGHWTSPGYGQPQPRQPPVFVQPIYQPQPLPAFPGQFPVYVTPNQDVGTNPYTGGMDTANHQVDNTYFQNGRNESANNGTRRFVRRPVYDANGNVVGYQEGYVWINSVTGQEHGDLINYTPNNKGGVHKGIQQFSVPN